MYVICNVTPYHCVVQYGEKQFNAPGLQTSRCGLEGDEAGEVDWSRSMEILGCHVRSLGLGTQLKVPFEAGE